MIQSSRQTSCSHFPFAFFILCPVFASCTAGLVLTGRNGMIPHNSFFTSNSTVLSPFEGAAGEYIRCGSTGGQPGWYNEYNYLVPMSTLNIHFNSAPDTGELWFDTMTRSTINRDLRCSPRSGSLTSLSSFIGFFFLHLNKLGEYFSHSFHLLVYTACYAHCHCTLL